MPKLILFKKASDPLWKIGKQIREATAATKVAKEDYERAVRNEKKLIDQYNQRRVGEFLERIAREGKGWCSWGEHVADVEKLTLGLACYSAQTKVFHLHTTCGKKEGWTELQRVVSRNGRYYFQNEDGIRVIPEAYVIGDSREIQDVQLDGKLATRWGIPPAKAYPDDK